MYIYIYISIIYDLVDNSASFDLDKGWNLFSITGRIK